MGNPLGYDDVGFVDPSRAMWVHELSGDELVFGLTAETSWVTITELGDGFVVDSKDGDSAF